MQLSDEDLRIWADISGDDSEIHAMATELIERREEMAKLKAMPWDSDRLWTESDAKLLREIIGF